MISCTWSRATLLQNLDRSFDYVLRKLSAMECPITICDRGKVKGSISKSLISGSKPVFRYRNLPFGRPPVGNLRFMPPQPAVPWQGVLDCTVPTKIPFQSVEMQRAMQHMTPTKGNLDGVEELMMEDCLRLSVYTPTINKQAKLPVMVWFYGGAFQMGFSEAFDGTALASLNDVVIVTPNYRVGVFGFFSLGPNSPCTGNAGLLDQHLALQWVQRNIENFGGDRDNVTLFGESAGGTAVNHHLNSPMSRGLFHKAISHSGQSTLAKIFKRDLSNARTNFFEILNIEEKDPKKILQQLQRLSARDLLEADQKLAMRYMNFNPTLDHKFIVKTPAESLRDKDFAKVPYIIGCNDSEGQGMLIYLAGARNFDKGISRNEMELFTSQFLPRMHPEAMKECQLACFDHYVGDGDESDKYRYSKAIGNIYTDSMFVAPLITTASAHQEVGSPVYVYFASYTLRFNHDEDYGPHVLKKVSWCKCDHGDDICMMWGVPFNPGSLSGGAKFTDEEAELSLTCMKYITNFAKSGNPNLGKHVDVSWPMFSPKGEYLNLHTTDLKAQKDLAPESVRFWKYRIPSIMEKFRYSVKNKL